MLKPVLLFVSGLVVASLFFLFHMDRVFAHMPFAWGERRIALSILPPGVPTADNCPVTYAVDNRTDRLVLLTLAGSAGPYAAPVPDDSHWHDRPNDGDHGYDTPPAAYGAADMTGFGGDANPESAEPGIRVSDDPYPDDSNYGGSSTGYGGEGARAPVENWGSDDAYGGYGNSYASRYGGGDPYGPAPGRYSDSSAGGADFFAGNRNEIPPPPPGQPIPLTPDDGVSSYGAPTAPGYNNPSDPNWDPPGSPVRPGEIFFASTPPPDSPEGQPPQQCDPSVHTVTVRLSN